MKFISRKKLVLAFLTAPALFSTSAFSAVSAEEAKQLGGATLTAFGSEKAGNKEGTIPAYTGEGVKTPADWDPKEPGRRPDPFRDEKPLFSITAQNASQYADKLDGLATLFKKYPNYRMDVYPTHRTMVYPKYVLDNTLKNATSCKGADGEVRLEGCYGGVTFPIPKSGAQVMWNHLTAYEVPSYNINVHQVIVPNTGSVVTTNISEGPEDMPFYSPAMKGPATGNTIFWRVRLDFKAPVRQIGEKLVIIDALDSINVGRRVYQYIPGQRRVKLAPDLAYDTPSPTGGGAITIDDSKVFLGAIDRYNWKLIGKKEKFIPYNAFKLTDYKGGCTEDQVYGTRHFPNPDCIRWELHRVWQVEATLKPGFRHIYPKRKMFYDEDAYASGVMEDYDATGALYRVVMANPFPMFEGGWMLAQFCTLDLSSGVWSSQSGINFPGGGYFPIKPPSELLFSPEALAGEGIR